MPRGEQSDGEITADGPLFTGTRNQRAAGALIAGRYRLERLIGEGGMGVVWEATHSITRKRVALKFLAQSGRSPQARKRFFREARAAAAVRHPNVIDIYDVLEIDGESPIIVMELLSGESLASRIHPKKRLPIEQAASIVLQVSGAVGAAHALGIIHRDLKPENIFLLTGEDDRVKVLDFGIAKLTADDGAAARTMALTEAGAIMGTPCFIAPEQLAAGEEIDHRTDIWALGLVLYRCLSGVLPTEAEHLVQVITIIATGNIPPLASHVPDVPAEIAGLVDRMLSRKREQRPADLREVAEVLARYAGGRAPSIGPPHAPELATSDPPPAPGPASSRRVDKGVSPFAETTEEAPPHLARRTVSDTAITLDLADSNAREGQRKSTRSPTSSLTVEPMVAPASACLALAFRPDSAIVATAHDNGNVILWDTATGTAIRALRGHTRAVHSLAISADGDQIVTGSADTTVRSWDLASGRCLFVLEGHTKPVRSVAISPDGRTIASANGASVLISPFSGGPVIRVLQDARAMLRAVAISPDGRLIATGAPHGVILIWEAATGRIIAEWRTMRAPLRELAFHPSGLVLASCGDNAVRLWSVDSGQVLHVLRGHSAAVRSVAFSPDGETIVSGGQDRTLMRWDVVTGRLVSKLEGHASAVHSVAFRPDGQMLAAGDDDRGVTLWNLLEGRARRAPRTHPAIIHCVAVSPGGETIAAGVEDGSIALWSAKTGQLHRSFPCPSGPPQALALSPDGQSIAVSVGDDTISIHAIATGQWMRTLHGRGSALRCVAFRPDGQSIAAGAADATIAIWDLTSDRDPRQMITGARGAVRSLAMSPDGQSIAAGIEDGTVRIFPLAAAEARLTLRTRSLAVGLAYRRDGGSLTAFAEDGSLTAWEADRGAVLISRAAEGPLRRCVAFSPDLRWIAGVGRDGMLTIADAGSAATLATLVKLAEGWVAFLPDGRYKLEGRADGSFWHVVRLDRFEPGDLDDQLPAPLRLPVDAPILP